MHAKPCAKAFLGALRAVVPRLGVWVARAAASAEPRMASLMAATDAHFSSAMSAKGNRKTLKP